jgi:hypothetical protein
VVGPWSRRWAWGELSRVTTPHASGTATPQALHHTAVRHPACIRHRYTASTSPHRSSPPRMHQAPQHRKHFTTPQFATPHASGTATPLVPARPVGTVGTVGTPSTVSTAPPVLLGRVTAGWCELPAGPSHLATWCRPAPHSPPALGRHLYFPHPGTGTSPRDARWHRHISQRAYRT